MSIYERGETYAHRIDIRNRLSVLTTPSSIKENIYDQCGHWLVQSQSMSSDAVGKFYYNYPLTSTATYGQYHSRVTATDIGGNVSIFTDEFWIMPWDIIQEVRDSMGIPEAKTVSDDIIARTAWNSYKFTLRELYTFINRECPDCNVETGAGFDGTNTTFQTKQYPIADINGDGAVTGSNTSCATDISGYWINSLGHYQTAKITVSQAEYGEISIFQNDGVTAIPSTNQGVWIDYWVRPPLYDDLMTHAAVVRLTCYELSKRLQSLDEVTLADIKNNSPIITLDPRMWYKEYKRYIGNVRGPVSGGVDL